MNRCDLRFDTPPEILADWLLEHAWTTQDLLAWWDMLLAAFLLAGGLDMVPDTVVVGNSWEMVLPREE